MATANRLTYSSKENTSISEYGRIADLYILHIEKFSIPEQLKLYIILQNIQRKFSKDKITALKVVFKVSKAALEHKVLGRNSSFSFTTFISIAMVGSIIGEFDYTKKFIEKYQHLLDASIRDDIKN